MGREALVGNQPGGKTQLRCLVSLCFFSCLDALFYMDVAAAFD